MQRAPLLHSDLESHGGRLPLRDSLFQVPDECSGTCGNFDWKGDNSCDDQNNNCGCEWDGGDCCGSNVNTVYCSACECLDPTMIDCCVPKGDKKLSTCYVFVIINVSCLFSFFNC